MIFGLHTNLMSHENSIKPQIVKTIQLTVLVLAAGLSAAWQAQTQDAKTPYPGMAAIENYLMERNAEVALAQSAAPESISRDA
jgi:hypothetical protein